MICFSGFLLISENPPCPSRALFTCVLLPFSSVAVLMRQFLETWGKQRQLEGNNPTWAESPMFCVACRCYSRMGAARTIDSPGQGSGVYVPPGCAAIADNAGLAPRILLVL